MTTTMSTDDCNRPSHNLLVSLYRLAHRQQENFVTESFVYVLQCLVERESSAARRILNWLTESEFFSQPTDLEALLIWSRSSTVEFGIPDMRIQGNDVDVIVEIKLDSGLTFEQAEAYAQALHNSPATRKTLVALLGGPAVYSLPEGIVVRTWGELGTKMLQETKQANSEVSRFLVDQFTGLLNYLYLMPLRVCSPLSEALQKNREWAEANPERPSIFRDRVTFFARLDDMKHLEPLKNLLLQMEQVLRHASETGRVAPCKLDSGTYRTVEPWIGFNIGNMAYYFYLPLGRPERLTFSRFRGGVDPDSFDGKCGELDRRYGKYHWRITLDLSAKHCRYFDADQNEQIGLIREFFEKAFECGERLQPEV